ncbi:MAG: ATP-binding protein [Pseudomonadota bacterium]
MSDSAIKKVLDSSLEGESVQSGYAYEPNLRILIVDDETEILNSYQEILASSQDAKVIPLRSTRSRSGGDQHLSSPVSNDNFEVVAVDSYDKAISAVKEAVDKGRPFALGFFDVMLGEGPDGYDLVKYIHSLDSKMYAVFVTAYNDRSIDSIQEFLGEDKTQRWDYLNKPFSHGEILQKARNFTKLYNLAEEKSLKDRQLEEARRQLVESEKLSSVAAVARGVSHEFGNLLMQIMGKADLCLANGQPDKMKEGLDVILNATQKANAILEKFKDLSNPHAKFEQRSPFLLHEVLDEALLLMEHKIKTSQLKVSRIKTESVQIEGYKTAMLQVIVNLTLNAIHAMGDSGQLDFTVSDLGSEAELRIRDYGPGVKEEDLGRVLEAFYTTKGSEGTGARSAHLPRDR